MSERKLQLVGNSSFSVSLPKAWVEKSNLGKQSPVFFQELDDGSLLILPSRFSAKKSFSDFSLKVEDFEQSISQVLFAVYYLGAEHITIFSGKEISDEVRFRIKETFRHMSGAEIVFEDSKKIVLDVFLDKSKVNVNNVLTRICLLICSSIKICLEKISLKEIERNEVEVDRLFHLASKIIMVSLNDANLLSSSGIKYKSVIVSYLLISKKLENIADEIEDLAVQLKKRNTKIKEVALLLSDLKDLIGKNFLFPVKNDVLHTVFLTELQKEKIDEQLLKISESQIRIRLRIIHRLIYDIEEEITSLSFYNRLADKKIL